MTVDFDAVDRRPVTVREPDSMKQERGGIDGIPAYLCERLSGC